MCIMPQRQVLIPPTAKASAIAVYMRVVLVFHLLYAVLNFLTGNWVQGVFDLLGALVGMMAIRSREGYSYQPVFCYCLFCAIRFVITLIFTGIAFSRPDLGTSTMARWQFWLVVVQAALAPFIFASGACLAWLLFQELKKVIDEMSASVVGGDDSGGGFYSGGPVAPSRAAPSNQTPLLGGASSLGGGGGGGVVSPPVVEPPNGFRPFAGQGHRLGGS